jgi:hypothetical protein
MPDNPDLTFQGFGDEMSSQGDLGLLGLDGQKELAVLRFHLLLIKEPWSQVHRIPFSTDSTGHRAFYQKAESTAT